jgi:hypothetical protein
MYLRLILATKTNRLAKWQSTQHAIASTWEESKLAIPLPRHRDRNMTE